MLAACMLLAACSSDEVEIPRATDDSTASATSKTRSLDEAIRIAEEAGATLFAEKGRATRSVDKSRVSVITERNSRSGASDTLIYALNFEDNGGFALISAPEAATPILAFTESGDFDECVENIGGLQLFMDNAKAYIHNVSANSATTYDLTIGSGSTVRPPLTSLPTHRLKINWGPKWPAGQFFKNGNAGCGPVAAAMALAYFEAPTSLALTYNERDMNSISMDWTELKKHSSTNASEQTNPSSHSCNASTEAHKNIGRLCRELAEQIGCWYSGENTLTFFSRIDTYLRNILTGKKFSTFRGTTIYAELELLGGIAVAADSNASGEHVWIVDGTHIIEGVKMYNHFTQEWIITDKHYVHCNWGFDGAGNGWFIDGEFDTSTDYDKDNSTSFTPFKYELAQYLIIR